MQFSRGEPFSMSRSAIRKMRKILTRTWRMAAHLARPIVGTITGADTPERVVALTFDDGLHPKFTPDLLDILQEHGAKATFFVVGAAVRRYPHIVRRAAEAGHAIGNHSWDHPSFPFISRRERFRQVHACAGVIAASGRKTAEQTYSWDTIGAFLCGEYRKLTDAAAASR